MKSSPIRTYGLVIGAFESGEKDKVIRLLGTETGKISIIAKRCRSIDTFVGSPKKNSRSTTSLMRQPELFDYGDFSLSSGRGSNSLSSNSFSGELYSLQNQTMLKRPFSLSDSIDKLILASFIAETLDVLTVDGNVEDGSYVTPALQTLQDLSLSASTNETLRIAFQSSLNLLSISGFGKPELWIQKSIANQDDSHQTRSPTPNKRNLWAIIKHIADIRGLKLRSESSIEFLLSKI